MKLVQAWGALLLVALAACRPSSPSTAPSSGPVNSLLPPPQVEAPQTSKTLTSLMRVEPASLASKALTATGISVAHAVRLFNAELDLDDGQETSHPYLAEALPQLNSDSWRVLPDGRMETTYRLRPNLTWHDGAALSADDFVFGYRVYSTPDLGQSATAPIRQMEDVVAPDSRTVVIRWRNLYPDAASLGKDFQALPRHLLEQPFQSLDAAGFTSLSYWTTDYVGLGPYKLERWEPGASIQAVAFDGHALGRAKIDRVVIRFIADENTALSNLLAGEVQFATDRTIRFEQAQVLKREWGATGGTPILTPNQPRSTIVQLRPEFARPSAILDVRVRRAFAHTIDRQALNDGLFGGEGVDSQTHIASWAPYFADVDRAIMHYPYDVRRAEQLMGDAGFTKDRDGFFAHDGERFLPNLRQDTGAQVERELAILLGSWRNAGFDLQVDMISSTQLRDIEYRSTFPTLIANASLGAVKNGERNLQNYISSQAGSVVNRWRGNNYGGWSNGEYDRLWDLFNTTLERGERNRQAVEMARLISEELPLYNLYWNFNVSAHTAALRGPDPKAIDALVNWNVHEWTLS